MVIVRVVVIILIPRETHVTGKMHGAGGDTVFYNCSSRSKFSY